MIPTNSAGTELESGLALVTGPQQEPVSLEEAKAHLRVSGTTDDYLIHGLIVAAREWAEKETRRKLITQTWRWTLDEWPAFPFSLPLTPVQSVTIGYVDEDDTDQTLAAANYTLDTGREPARLVLGADVTLPTIGADANGVTISMVVGYGLAAKVPQKIGIAMLLHIQAHYDRDVRELETILKAASNLLATDVYHSVV